jgi:undecaprenyl-diphosphatase
MMLVRRLRSMLAARLDTNTWLGLGLSLCVVVSMAAIWLFASLLDAVLDNATLVRFDIAADRTVHASVTPAGTAAMQWVSRIGSPVTVTIVAVFGALELLRRARPRLLIIWIAAIGGASLLDRTLKTLVHRSRPLFAGDALRGTFSFPSGHAMMSLTGSAMLVYVLIVIGSLPAGRRRSAVIVGGSLFVGLVGISRVYLGAHYPSDVLGGWTAAAAWVAACVAVSEVWRGRVESASSSRQVPPRTLQMSDSRMNGGTTQ